MAGAIKAGAGSEAFMRLVEGFRVMIARSRCGGALVHGLDEFRIIDVDHLIRPNHRLNAAERAQMGYSCPTIGARVLERRNSGN